MAFANSHMSIFDSEFAFVHAFVARLSCHEVVAAGMQGFRTDCDAYSAWIAQSLLFEREKDRLAQALLRKEIGFVWLKGAALRQTLYPNPQLRAMSDLDLLIQETDLDAADALLRELGYRTPVTGLGSEQVRERQYVRTIGAFQVPIDLHWDLNSAPALRGRLGANLLIDSADSDRCVTHVHAFIHACLHRAANRVYERNRPVWLLDIVLLWSAMTSSQKDEVVQLARDRSLQTVCFDGLRAAAEFWGVDVNHHGLSRLPWETTAQLLQCTTSWQRFVVDIRHLPNTASRLRWICQALFPPKSYMRARGRRGGALLLPWRYLSRALGGVINAIRGRTRR